MKNKEIQEKRMKGYFIQATKEILKGEGLRAVSVRNVADRAGYSYATLYNYFKDAKDLIFECVKDFQDECRVYIENSVKHEKSGIGKIKAISKAYMGFFVQYPGVFELFFIEKTTDIAGKQPTIEMILSFLNELCDEEWVYAKTADQLSVEKEAVIKEQLNFVVTGIMLLYLHRRYPVTFSEFNELADRQLDAVLSC